MIGEVVPTRLVRKTRLAVGDRILLTRGVAIEGTAILAREKSEQLRGRVDADLLARAARFLIEPGISVVSAALAAADVGEAVQAMHDPTEGGLATGLSELVAPAGLGLRVIREHIPVAPETDAICGALALDPLKLIASGALLIAVAADSVDPVLKAIGATGIPVVVIGEVRPSSEGHHDRNEWDRETSHARSSRRDCTSPRMRLRRGRFGCLQSRNSRIAGKPLVYSLSQITQWEYQLECGDQPLHDRHCVEVHW